MHLTWLHNTQQTVVRMEITAPVCCYENRLKRETLMLSKCANPSCFALFRYFHQGKLFRMEMVPEEDRNTVAVDATKIVRGAEFFWLLRPLRFGTDSDLR